MDEAAWGALALTLSLLGGIYTWTAYRRRGLPAGLRGAGITLLPLAAWLTDTLRLLTRIGDAVGDWAARLAFSPSLWVGIIVGGVAITLLAVAGVLERRGIGTRATGRARDHGATPAVGPSGQRAIPAVDDEMAEIEAILRKRGIS